jgi:hypothetical protein
MAKSNASISFFSPLTATPQLKNNNNNNRSNNLIAFLIVVLVLHFLVSIQQRPIFLQ